MTILQIQLLGTFRLETKEGETIQISSKKARVLLAYLAVFRRSPISRIRLGDLLWEHHEEQQAQTNLRQCLSVLNRALEPIAPDWLIRNNGCLAFNDQLWVADISSFSADPDADNLKSVLEKVSLYRGEFLYGAQFHENILMEWVNAQRRNYQLQYIENLKILLDFQCKAEDHDGGLETAQELLRYDPLDEAIHRQAMQIFSILGQRHRILRQFHQCQLALESADMGAPQDETIALFQQLYQQTVIQPVFDPGATSEPEIENTEVQISPAIAVLPFSEPGGAINEYSMSTALTEEIVHELRRYHGFRVISALSSLSLANTTLNLQSAANKLGARYLVGGSIRKQNEQLQISVELADSDNGELIWAERYHRRLEDLFLLQAELARDIAGAIEPEAVGHAYLLTSRKSPSSLSAWDLVLRGDHQLFLQIGTRWNSDQAQGYYRKAMQLEPDYAPAYTGIAYSQCLELKEDIASDRSEVERSMLEMARQGASLDPNNPWCLVVLGRVLQQMREYDQAILTYRKAVELCPSSSKAHFGLGFGLSATGHYDDAVESIDRAIELSPRDPMNWSFHTVKALAYLYAEKFDLAEEASRLSVSNPRANHWAPAFLAPSLVHLGRYDDALKALENAKKTKPALTLDVVENAFTVEDDSAADSVRKGLVEAGLK